MLLIFKSGISLSQTKTIKFLDLSTHEPIPFVAVYNSDFYKLSDVNGGVPITESLVNDLLFYHPYYESITLNGATYGGDSVYVPLKRNHLFDVVSSTAMSTVLFDSIIANLEKNDIDRKLPYSYNSYNKLRVTPLLEDRSQKSVIKVLDYFQIDSNAVSGDHHVLLSESVTTRACLNKLRSKEVVLYSKFSGVSEPKVVSLNSQIQTLNVYNRYISIFDNSYLSPVQNRADSWYKFRVLDTIKRANDDLFIVQFNPSGKVKQVLLSGVLYISSNQWAVEAAIMKEDKKEGSFFESYFQYQFIEGNWLPFSYSTSVSLTDFIVNGFKLRASYATYLSDFRFQVSLKRSLFDDVSIEYLEPTTNTNELFLVNHRAEYFSKKDSNTYIYYDSLGSIKNIDKAYIFANNIRNKEIKLKDFNLDFKRAFDYNKVEGGRIGFGVNKTLLINDKLKLGGHLAYSFKDQEAKYEIYGKLKVFQEHKLEVLAGFNRETFEAASAAFSFYSYQYTTEWLRRFSINTLDYTNQYYFGIESNPIKYTSLLLKLKSSNNTPSYAYAYRGEVYSSYQYTDLEFGMRFAFGENYFKLLDGKYKLKSKYPILWTKINWGMDNVLGGAFDYFKVDLRMEYRLRSFLMGRTTFQVNSGYAEGDLPYFQLFEGYGADGAAVAHNRFETMRINEFISDRYLNFFITYEFVKLYFRQYPNFRPTVELDYNFGIGSLKHIDYHEKVYFNTLEKGYHEVGVSLKSILTVKITSIKVGLGFGNYFRFGPYRYGKVKDNYFGKLLLTFSL